MATPEDQHKAAAQTSQPQPQPTLPPIPAPILTLPNCLIRPYHPSDAEQIAAAANNPDVAKYMRNTFPHPYTFASAISWIDLSLSASPLLNFGIYSHSSSPAASPSSQEFLGSIGLRPLPDVECRTYEVGYWIAPQAWGRGLATEALRDFSRWAFETFGELLRLEAGVYGGNEASARVLGKAGYVYEGTRRRAVWKNGEVLDLRIYGLLREECLGEGR